MIIDTPERARQFLWVLASDLWMYRKKDIIAAPDRGTLLDSLRDDIEKTRLLFESRVSPEIFQRGTFDQTLVDLLVKLRNGAHSP